MLFFGKQQERIPPGYIYIFSYCVGVYVKRVCRCTMKKFSWILLTMVPELYMKSENVIHQLFDTSY
jgi:hypothetical protein